MSILPNGVPTPTEDDLAEDPWAYYSIAKFRYVVLDLETLDVTPVSALGEVAAGSATPLTVDNRAFLQIYDGDEGAGSNLYGNHAGRQSHQNRQRWSQQRLRHD